MRSDSRTDHDEVPAPHHGENPFGTPPGGYAAPPEPVDEFDRPTSHTDDPDAAHTHAGDAHTDDPDAGHTYASDTYADDAHADDAHDRPDPAVDPDAVAVGRAEVTPSESDDRPAVDDHADDDTDHPTAEHDTDHPAAEHATDHPAAEDDTAPVVAEDTAPVVVDEDAAPTELKPGDADVASETTFWAAESTGPFRDRWREAQLRFVDDPGAAAEEIQGLVGEAVDAVSAALAAQRQDLDGWTADGDGPRDTERLRVVVQRYRAFFDRLLSL